MFSGGSGSHLKKSDCKERILSMLKNKKEVFDFPGTETEVSEVFAYSVHVCLLITLCLRFESGQILC